MLKKEKKCMKYLLWNRYCKEDSMNIHFNSERFLFPISTTFICFSNKCDLLRKKKTYGSLISWVHSGKVHTEVDVLSIIQYCTLQKISMTVL